MRYQSTTFSKGNLLFVFYHETENLSTALNIEVDAVYVGVALDLQHVFGRSAERGIGYRERPRGCGNWICLEVYGTLRR